MAQHKIINLQKVGLFTIFCNPIAWFWSVDFVMTTSFCNVKELYMTALGSKTTLKIDSSIKLVLLPLSLLSPSHPPSSIHPPFFLYFSFKSYFYLAQFWIINRSHPCYAPVSWQSVLRISWLKVLALMNLGLSQK